MATALVAVGSCGEAPPKEPADLLNGHRYVVPATRGGLQLPDDCDIDARFIPIATCASAPERDNLRALRKQLLTLRGNAQADDRLYDWVSAELASGAADNETARQAVAIIQRGLTLGEDGEGATGSKRAQLLTDLSAAYLLVAEETQSAVEVLAALEASLEALELEELPEAKFNRDLALVLLGVLGPGDVEGEPVLWELAGSFPAGTPSAAEDSSYCPDHAKIRAFLDQWSEDPSSHQETISELLECTSRFADRFLYETLDKATTEPDSTANAWRNYKRAQQAFRSFEREALLRQLAELNGSSIPRPIRVAADYFQAMLPYFEGDFELTKEKLLAHERESTHLAYYELSVTARRGLALLAAAQSEHQTAFSWLDEALIAIEKAESEDLLSSVQGLRITLLATVGRESYAWNELSEVLRTTVSSRQPTIRSAALEAASSLAEQRGFANAALALQREALRALDTLSNPAARIGGLLRHSELLLSLGRTDSAQADLEEAEAAFSDSVTRNDFATKLLEGDLNLLRGMLAEDAARSEKFLSSAIQSHRAMGYSFRIVRDQLQLARSKRNLGDPEGATALLRESLSDLAMQVTNAGSWPAATALVASARPMAEELVGLLLESNEDQKLVSSLASYLGLRSGAAAELDGRLEEGQARWSTFSLGDQLLHVVETTEETVVLQSQVTRVRLSQLRELLLNQLREGAPTVEVDPLLSKTARP